MAIIIIASDKNRKIIIIYAISTKLYLQYFTSINEHFRHYVVGNIFE